MTFNLDPAKKAQKMIFSRKIKNPYHAQLHFNNTFVKKWLNLSLILDTQLNFEEHIKTKFTKVAKTALHHAL